MKRIVVGDNGTAPVQAPLHIKATAEPTATPTKGDIYFDSTANALMQYTGSAWEQVGSSPSDDLTIGDDLNVGDDLNLTSTGAVITIGPAATNPVILTHTADTLTVAASDTIAITTADKLTVGGVIVPQHFYINHSINPMATITEYDIFTCIDAFEVVAMRVVPSTLQGGAATATLVKASGTATPVKTTTPLHIADAIDLNAGAYTVQTITPTVTGADLIFAAGDRLSIDFSTAITVGKASVTIKCKRV